MALIVGFFATSSIIANQPQLTLRITNASNDPVTIRLTTPHESFNRPQTFCCAFS